MSACVICRASGLMGGQDRMGWQARVAGAPTTTTQPGVELQIQINSSRQRDGNCGLCPSLVCAVAAVTAAAAQGECLPSRLNWCPGRSTPCTCKGSHGSSSKVETQGQLRKGENTHGTASHHCSNNVKGGSASVIMRCGVTHVRTSEAIVSTHSAMKA